MKRTMRTALYLLPVVLLLGAGLFAEEGSGARREFEAARTAMADRDYPRAASLLSAYIGKYGVGERVEEAGVLLVRARLGVKDYEGALEAGRRFLSGYRGSSLEGKVRFLMGEAFARMRGFEDAARIYREQVDFLGGDAYERKVAGYYLELAGKAFEGEEKPDEFGRKKLVKDYGAALRYYEKARSIRLSEKDAPEVSYRIGKSRYEVGDRAGAVKEWKKLLTEWPESGYGDEATYGMGLALMKLGKTLEARKALNEVGEKYGDSKWAPEALIALGETYRPLQTKDEEELARGLSYWKAFWEKYPSHERAEEVLGRIGEAEYRFGHYDAAIAECKRFLAAFPEGKGAPAALDMIGMSYYGKEEYDRAIGAWKEFLSRWPNDERWTAVQGRIGEATFAKGLTPYRRWKKAAEKEKESLLLAAEKGFRAFLAAYPVHAHSGEAQLYLGEIEHRRKAYDRAVAEWRIAASKYAKTKWAPAALFRIGRALEQDRDDLPGAIETYEEIGKRYPRSAEARAAKKLLLELRKKELSVSTERVRRSDEPCAIRVVTRNIGKLRVRAYAVDLEEVYREKGTVAGLAERVEVPVLKPTWEGEVTVPEYEKYRRYDRQVTLPLKGPGAWIVTMQEEDLTATTLVVVSDLTVVTKESPGQTLLFAVNEKTGDPWPGVRVLTWAGGKVVAEGRTREDGTYLREGDPRSGEVKFFAEAEGNVATAGLRISRSAGFGYTTKVYLYTDRPLYRPGQEVHLRGIYRKVAKGSYAPTAGDPLLVEVRDPEDTVVFAKRLVTNDYGTVSATLRLPAEAATGTFRITARPEGERRTFTGSFVVREYVKPEFTITARKDRRTYLPGEEVRFEVALRYFFGGPVPETVVRYRVLRGGFAFDATEEDEFAWFTRDPAREALRRRIQDRGMVPVTEGELRTDADGNAKLAFRAENLDEDARYLVLFEALDLNRRWVRESVPVVVTRQGYYALVSTAKKVARPGEEIPVRVRTVDALHFPVAARGELVAVRLGFRKGRATRSEVSRQALVTEADGRATVRVKVSLPGEYELRYEGKDRAGMRVLASAGVTLSGEAEDLSKQAKVVAARRIYREGEVAEVLVNTPAAPAWALLTFEGERVIDYRVVRLTERSTTLRLLMKPSYSPNVYVRIAVPAEGKLNEAGDEVYVLRYLDVKVEPAAKEARPGDEAAFTVRTTDQRGQPVAAEVGVAVIDRSILALEPDRTPQIKPFFYDQRRKRGVATGSSYSFRYRGVTVPTNKDVIAEELRKLGREKFNRTMKYVNSGKEYLERGDLESAAIEFRKALQVSPENYVAREQLARTMAKVMARRAREKSEELAKKEGSLSVSGGAGGAYGGRHGGRYQRPSAEVPPGMREPADAGRPGKPMARSKANGPAQDKFAGDWKAGKRLRKDMEDAEQDRPGAAALVPAELRARFADTAYWSPHVVTGPDGTAKVTFTLPDNLTTWRAVVRGATRETLVGEGTADLVARKDLLVRIDTPRFLVQKDRTTITATVHNSTGREVAVHLGLTPENVTLAGAGEATARLAPNEIHPFDFPLVAAEPGLAKLSASALTTVASDAARRGLPVLPHGERTVLGRSGELTEEAVEVFDLPEGIVPGTRDLRLTLTPGIDSSLVESLIYLRAFPYGCLEQTVNRFLPAIAADRALRAIGSPNLELRERLRETVEQGLLALYSFQNPDGSFGWFSGRRRRVEESDAKRRPPVPEDAEMTALAILGMERAREAGYRVSERHRARALLAGARILKRTRDAERKSLLLYALSLAGKAELSDLNQVYRLRDGLSPYALAVLSLAMVETKRDYNALSLVTILKAKAIEEKGWVHWEGSGRFGIRNAVETTAYALRAVLRVDPESDLPGRAASWLLAQRRGRGWSSTRDTGAAVSALSAYLVKTGVTAADYVVEVWWNGGKVPYEKVAVAGGRVANDASRTVVVDGARMRTGRNVLRLVKKGPGRCTYALTLSYVTEAEKIAPEGNLLRVERSYREWVSPVAAKEGREEIRPGWTVVRPEKRPKGEPGKTIDRAGSGDKFRVRIRLTAREDLPYVIVTDPLPAGVEVVEGQSRGPFDREERRDTRQVFYLSRVPAGTVDLSYVVQAIHPGEYHALPAEAYPMYEPGIRGRSGENLLTVVPEPGAVGRPSGAEGITPDEIFGLAVRDYRAKRWEKTRDALLGLVKDYALLDRYQEECQAMLMRASFALSDHKGAVQAYERLSALNPRRGPKTTKERRALAVSYQELGEWERALALFKGVLDEYFLREREVAETYRNLGNPWESQRFTEDLLRRYPDSNVVVETAYRTALRYAELKEVEKEKKEAEPAAGVSTGLMLPEALQGLREFLANYPESSRADDADRMEVTLLNRMERYPEAEEEARRFLGRYRDSVHRDDVLLYLAESYYEQGEYDRVFATGGEILTGKFRTRAGSREKKASPFVPDVKYLFAKIHHLRGELPQAVSLYREVAGRFPDAAAALTFLTREELLLPETAEFEPGAEVKLQVRRKNVTKLSLRIYPVDLMLLIAVRKDLRKANSIDLAGIATQERQDLSYGKGKDYRWHKEEVKLPIGRKGVYLVVARSEGRVRTSLVLVTELALSVQGVGDRVRVYATDRKTGAPVSGAFVKVSDGKAIRSQGFTDARGIFEGKAGRGPVMVVAEKGDDSALFRR